MTIEVEKQFKENQRFRFPNSQSHSFIRRDAVPVQFPKEACASSKYRQGYRRKSLIVKAERSVRPEGLELSNSWFLLREIQMSGWYFGAASKSAPSEPGHGGEHAEPA